jgi:hypothetical protein
MGLKLGFLPPEKNTDSESLRTKYWETYLNQDNGNNMRMEKTA